MPARPIALAAAVVLLILLAVAPAAPATSTTTCRLSSHEQQSLGPSYVTGLRVTGTSCARGKVLVRAFQRCRMAGGVRGRCHQRLIRGFRCREARGEIPSELTGKVTCTKSHVTVLHTYTQLIT